MSALELQMKQRGTREFIAADTTRIALIPTETELLDSGARSSVDGTPRDEQDFKLIPMTFDQRATITVDGVERIIDYTLLGAHDCLMAVWDHWTGDDGSIYTVVAVAPGHGYETKGLVERHMPAG